MRISKKITFFIQKPFKVLSFINYFVLAIILSVTNSSCNKASAPTPNNASSNTSANNDSIIYKSYVVDSVNFSSDSILYDVNNDNINDILVTMQHTLNGSSMTYSGNISSIHNNMSFCYINTQSSWTMLGLNDNVNGVNSFNWNTNCSYSGNSPYFTGSNSWAQGIFTKYFGFKITLNTIDYYGWLHFKYQSISETGVNLSPNKTINVGQKM